MGCCNRECFAENLVALCPYPTLRRKYVRMLVNRDDMNELYKHFPGSGRRNIINVQRANKQFESTSSSSSGNQKMKEMYDVIVIVLKQSICGSISRQRFKSEMSSTEQLDYALKEILRGSKEALYHTHIYMDTGEDQDTAQLLQINMEKFGHKKLRFFPNTRSTLRFVVDYANIVKSSAKSPFM